MSRLRRHLHRARRMQCDVIRLRDGWYAVDARGWGYHSGPFTRRQAILVASSWALPHRAVRVIITSGTF